jgi:succinyl-CoA synthetase beta subunit
MVAEALDIARETYLAILLDRAYGGAVLMGSPMGGVDIEEVAEKHPDQIFTVGLFYLIKIKIRFILKFSQQSIQ